MKVLDKGYIELLDHMGNDNTVVNAARVSYLGESKGLEQDEKLIYYLMKNLHSSPFEQVEFQFRIKCPLIIVRQWHRHRTWSYNEVSRRYTSEEIDFHFPDILRRQANHNKQVSYVDENYRELSDKFISEMKINAQSAYDLYIRMVDAGFTREQAREILPQNMFVSYYAKTDLHNLFHFLKLRNHPHSQEEIRVYAQAIEELIKPIVPVSYKAWVKYGKDNPNDKE
jgi:thymidylate synthase (FAD)